MIITSPEFFCKRNGYIMKKLVLPIFVGMVAAVTILIGASGTQSAVSEELIRLHVRANSNSDADQELKLCVRDAILAEARNLATDCKNAQEAEAKIADNLDKILVCAKNEVTKQGYSYPVSIGLGKSPFPAKTYGDITLPAGTYKALTVEIGKGKGNNWWCVMFPPLCFTEETVAATADTDKILMENLDKETYSAVKQNGFQIKFKIYESILNAKSKIQNMK